MTSMMTNPMGLGPGATVSTAVPDFHHFAGRGGKDVISLYRDSRRTPNVDPMLLETLTGIHRAANASAPKVTAEQLFAYTFGILAGADYTTRFRGALQSPGPRVPITSDPTLFAAMAAHGERL